MGLISPLVLLVSLARAQASAGPGLALDPLRDWARAVALEGQAPGVVQQGAVGSSPVVVEVPGLAAPRVGIAWPLAADQERSASVMSELIAGPAGVFERRLVFTQEVAVRVDGGAVAADGGGGALVVVVQLRPGVHPGVAQAAIEATVEELLALDDARLQAEIDRASAARARDRRLSGQPPADSAPPVGVAELRSFAATLGMPAAWRVTVFLPEVGP
jgi:hypothetical protein